MASLPPTAQRRTISTQAHSSSSSASAEAADRHEASNDTVYLNDPSAKVDRYDDDHEEQDSHAQAASPSAAEDGDQTDPRKCWICFSDETEDTPLSSSWRSPCPCALTAHESCLLDWIADMETSGRRKRSAGRIQIQCPQCKSDIIVARPQSLVVDAVDSLDRLTGELIFPGVLSVLGGCVWTGSMIYGINTVHLVFGTEEAARILGGAMPQRARVLGPDYFAVDRVLFPFWNPHAWSWRLGLGLPLIPALLVLSRTNLADRFLPIVPLIFFVTQSNDKERLDLGRWPPTPALTLTILPYLREAYNGIYGRLFGEIEKQWMKEIRGRSGAEDAQGAGGAGREEREANAEGDAMLAVDLQIDLFGGEEEADDPQLVEEDAEAPGVNRQPIDGQAQQGAQQPAPQPGAAQRNDYVISTSRLADTVLGALLFPAISAAMGQILKLTLPKAWVNAPPGIRNPKLTGFLQARWGRSIAGGCLFVVLKDALMLYYRWKQVQRYRNRRVLNYDKKLGKVVR